MRNNQPYAQLLLHKEKYEPDAATGRSLVRN
jgi:hypothetical protein